MSDTIIVWIQQQAFPGLIPLMKGVTALGNETFYLLGLPVLFWCWKKELALPLLILLYLTFLTNTLLKLGFASPRPAEALHLVPADGYGFPSGHAQMAMVLWGYLGWRTGWNKSALTLIFLIGLSRIVLGVHYPADVIGGWTIGLVLLTAGIALEDRLKQSTRVHFSLWPTVFLF
ncbi:MAG: phosphatase PAP2 family protein, partial [Candidatus Neomarinimicrobiota bacterium]